MKFINRLVYIVFGAMLLSPLIAAVAGQTQQEKPTSALKPNLPPGPGKDLLVKDCSACHQLTVVSSQHKSEEKWTDTVGEMRNRGAHGSDDDMEQIIHYLTANFGPESAPTRVNVNSAQAGDIVTGLSLTQAEADAIVAHRDKNGKYKDIADLEKVSGIEAAKIDAVKERIDF